MTVHSFIGKHYERFGERKEDDIGKKSDILDWKGRKFFLFLFCEESASLKDRRGDNAGILSVE